MLSRNFQPSFTDDIALARDYSLAFFQDDFDLFVNNFKATFADFDGNSCIAEIGSYCADIATRLAIQYPQSHIYSIEPLESLLFFAKPRVDAQRLHENIRLYLQSVENIKLPLQHFDALISYTMLHRTEDPADFWQALKAFANPGTRYFIADYIRPDDLDTLQIIARQLSANEPPSITQMTQRALLSAFNEEEISLQLQVHEMTFLKLSRHQQMWYAQGVVPDIT
jgi:ubiquinone/menaquinone biosynthesis C-methylase UbiE